MSAYPAPRVLDTFYFFPELPPELRLRIWKHTITPRRVFIGRGHLRPKMCDIEGALLLVNWETKTLFDAEYDKLFLEARLQPVYFNSKLDTLCLPDGLDGLTRISRDYAPCLASIKRIEIAEKKWTIFPIQMMDLSCMESDSIITVRRAVDDLMRQSQRRDGKFIINNLEQLKRALLQYSDPSVGYSGPKLAALFSTKFHDDGFYFETTSDLSHVRYGEIKSYDRHKTERGHILVSHDESEITYLEQDAEWEFTHWRHPRFPTVYPMWHQGQWVMPELDVFGKMFLLNHFYVSWRI